LNASAYGAENYMFMLLTGFLAHSFISFLSFSKTKKREK